MKRKLSILMAALLALVISVTTIAPVFAQGEDGVVSENGLSSLDGLALIAPVWVPLDTIVTMTVLQRSDATPVEGAGIWALTRERADALNEELASVREANATTIVGIDWGSLVEIHGEFLGRTDEQGKLEATFSESGRYLLVSVKRGYLPGRTHINAGTPIRALGIEAPRRALPGETVNMAVFQQGSSDPVEGAGVWALTREEAEALKAEVESMRAENEAAIADADWEALVSIRGIFLGRTDGNGKLEYVFTAEGGYLLITVKRGYLPGRTGIAIRELPKGLALETWRWALIGEEVTMTVSDRNSGDPVEGAGIWALTREEAEALKVEVESMRAENEAALASADWEALVSVRGIFLDRTDGNGEVRHVFVEQSGYALIAVKSGYLPGHAFIIILPPRIQAMSAEHTKMYAPRPMAEPAIQ